MRRNRVRRLAEVLRLVTLNQLYEIPQLAVLLLKVLIM